MMNALNKTTEDLNSHGHFLYIRTKKVRHNISKQGFLHHFA
ncbi:hypothetical protein EDB29_1011129 [Vibrio crassostreae]|nr:hypothetical protein EDB29_1011129 [Vibrio crassostreae]